MFRWFPITSIAAAAACSSAPAPVENPTTPAPPADAAVAAPPDAGLPDAVVQAPAWIFRYHTAQRTETWTLRYAAGQALLVVDGAQGAIRYTGTATDGDSLALAVATSTAKLALDCKREQKPLSAKCNDTKAKPVEVLDCYHPDFKSPMTFGAAPGVEYVADATCTGFRLIAP